MRPILPPLARVFRATGLAAAPHGRVAGLALRPATDRLSALIARHVSIPVSLREVRTGEIEAAVPSMPECRVLADTREAALGRLRATIVARLGTRNGRLDADAIARARPGDAVSAPGCSWTEIVLVIEDDAAARSTDRA